MAIPNINRLLADQSFSSYNLLRNQLYDKPDLAKILEIYSFGTVSDYYSHQDELLQLNDDQLLRLRQLTLISMSRHSRRIMFSNLQKALYISETNFLDTILSLANPGVIEFKVDERNECIEVNEILQVRDVMTKQDRPLLILQPSDGEVGTPQTVSQMINYLKFFKDVKMNKVENALNINGEDTTVTSNRSGVKRRLEG